MQSAECRVVRKPVGALRTTYRAFISTVFLTPKVQIYFLGEVFEGVQGELFSKSSPCILFSNNHFK